MYKAILVDDEILVREAICENIDWESLGYTLAQGCQNGKEAIEYIQENPVDLVLTDINMPYVDGLELSKYIHENHPEIVVVIFSGYSEFDYAKKAIQYNVAEYLLKPVTPKELITVLRGVKESLDERLNKQLKIEKLQAAYSDYTKNESIIIANELSSLVQGTQDSQICLNHLQRHGIELTGAYFRVAVMDIDIFAEGAMRGGFEKKESALMSFVVENISDEIIRETNSGVAYRDKVGRVCILMYTNKPREFAGKVAQIIEKIRETIYESMKLTLSIGVGNYVQEIESLYESYENALLMKKYQFVKGTSIYFDYEKEKEQLNATMNMEGHLRCIANALKGENLNSFTKLCEDVKKEMSVLYIEENNAITYLHQMMIQIYATLVEVSGENKKNQKEKEHAMQLVSSAGELSVAMNIVQNYGTIIFEKLADMCNSSGKKQTMLAVAYLNENYGDKDLGLATICSYLNISTSHFSSIYKEVTGETFMETLAKVRMEKAKQLLTETNLKNYEIADRVGYSDPHYFNIAFKKMVGQTPKEFAKENRKNG